MFTAEWKEKWAVKIKVLVITCAFAAVSNWINTSKAAARAVANGAESIPAIIPPLGSVPALLCILAVILVANLLDDVLRTYLKIKMPSIIYISLISIICSVPGFSPIAEFYNGEINKIGLLPLCTPILAYAGISLGKDWAEFKEQGLGIVLTACGAFAGTYIGSAIIAQIVLAATGQI